MVKRLNRCNGRREDAGTTGNSRVSVLTVLACIVGIVLVALLPALNRARVMARTTACESNLKQIGMAFRTWEGDYHDLYPMRYYTNADGSAKYADGSNAFRYFQVMSNELKDPSVVACPSDERDPAADFEHLKNQNVSYFVGLQADEKWPAMLLSGDRNLVTNGVDVVPGLVIIGTNTQVDWSAKMHNQTGNFGLADGSVQRGTSYTFQMFLGRTGTNMTRLAVP